MEYNGKIRVLVAEDDPHDLKLLQLAIAQDSAYAEFNFVGDGEQALAYLKGEGEFAKRKAHPFPELLVLDLKMPRLTGLEVLEWVRKHEECGHMPVLFLSGSGLPEDVEEAYKLGANAYFTKPRSVAALVAMIRAITSFWRMAERPHVPEHCA